MDCNVIKDLIPLYVDGCCSAETAKIAKEHIDRCDACKRFYEEMKAPVEADLPISAPTKFNKVEERKASVLQSALLFASFAVITLGVALEAKTPSGFTNGYFAFSLVVPATGFMLSLANWYFVRLYKSRKSFSNGSLLSTVIMIFAGFAWSAYHYGANFDFFSEVFGNISATDFWEAAGFVLSFMAVGFLASVILCILSKVLSNKFAKLLGKE